MSSVLSNARLHSLNLIEVKGVILLILADYLNNPYGKGAGIAPNAVIKADLMEQYYRLSSKMTCDWYRPEKSVLVAHLTLPSRTKRGIHYDIVFEFDISGMDEASVITVAQVPCKVFSNCPSFSYTYANVFEDKKELCKWLKDKYDKNIFKKEPETRNPNKIVGYERSIFIAATYIQRLGIQARLRQLLIRASTLNRRGIANKIQEQNDLERRYNAALYVEDERNKPKKEESKNGPKATQTSYDQHRGRVKSVATVKTIDKIKPEKNAKTGLISHIKGVGKMRKI